MLARSKSVLFIQVIRRANVEPLHRVKETASFVVGLDDAGCITKDYDFRFGVRHLFFPFLLAVTRRAGVIARRCVHALRCTKSVPTDSGISVPTRISPRAAKSRSHNSSEIPFIIRTKCGDFPFRVARKSS